VRKVVDELDLIEANEREQIVFHLNNAKAKDLEATLQTYFSTEAQTMQRTLGGEQGISGSVARQLEQEVTVVGDEKSNKLLISASPRYLEAVEEIVTELDTAPPQVEIQVLIAEVTLDNENTWGADIKVGGVAGIGPDAYKFGSLAAGGAMASALGTPNLSVSSIDFELMVRALEVQGKLEVLSRPSITVKNNEEARIQVGENVGLLGGTTQSGSGNVTASIEREDVGIILQVTPTINDDGFVQLDINPEISTLTSKTIQLSGDLQTPIIARRVVDTTVSVMDGQTVAIGGLIQTTEERRDWKVPFVGDIPILGLPFRSSKLQNVKTELLVILTPRVIPGGKPAVKRYQHLTDIGINRVTDPSRIIEEIGPRDASPDIAPPALPSEGPESLAPVNMEGAPRVPAKRVGATDGGGPAAQPSQSTIDWSSTPRVPAKRKDPGQGSKQTQE
jgi:general secretion pathway protein D